MKLLRNLSLTVGLTTALLVAPAHASFTGGTVSANYLFPNQNTAVYPSGTAVVGAGVEFNDIGGFGVGTSPQADFGSSSITVTYSGGWDLSTVNGVTFDGWVFTDEGGTINNIVNATLSFTDIAGFASTAVISFDANHVYVNQLGLANIQRGGSFTLGVAFAQPTGLPEPTSLLLVAGAVAALALARKPRTERA